MNTNDNDDDNDDDMEDDMEDVENLNEAELSLLIDSLIDLYCSISLLISGFDLFCCN